MNRRTAKRTVRVRTIRRGSDPRTAEVSVRVILAPHKWKRLREYYDRYDTSQVFEHDPRLSARMVAVLGRKPRSGRRRR